MRIVPFVPEGPREFGAARELFASGKIVVSDDFDAPPPEEMLRRIYGA